MPDTKNHRLRVPASAERSKARAASIPRIAYSRKCPSLRTRKCMNMRVSGEAFGNSQFNNGPIKLAVFEAEKLADEAREINAIQRISGREYLTKPRCAPRAAGASIMK